MARLPMQRLRGDGVGLCARCAHAKTIRSSKGTTFYLCLKSVVDARFVRYPSLPVKTCVGFQREASQLTLFTARDHNTRVAAPRITKEDLKQRLESGTPPVLVDARLKYPYEHSTVRLPGAVRYTGDAAPALPRDREIVVYDSDPNELASSRVASDLLRQGYRASALKGGIVDWLAANFPTETKDAPKQAPPEPGALKG
jgi:rhodanese-related sulfurtransferase